MFSKYLIQSPKYMVQVKTVLSSRPTPRLCFDDEYGVWWVLYEKDKQLQAGSVRFSSQRHLWD